MIYMLLVTLAYNYPFYFEVNFSFLGTFCSFDDDLEKDIK